MFNVSERKINRASIRKGKENKQIVHIVLFAIGFDKFIYTLYEQISQKTIIIHINKKQIKDKKSQHNN